MNPRIPIKKLVTVGTTFLEKDRESVVTRVTDTHFDTLDKESGYVRVRNLELWDWPNFTNSLSAVRGLLRISSNGVGS